MKNELSSEDENNSDISEAEESETKSLITDNQLISTYNDIMQNLKNDRDEISDLVNTFSDMVINEGDASNSSKEALVNLVKAKIETSDKMSKIADLMTRVKLKESNTYKPYLKGGPDKPVINIYDQQGFNKRSVIDSLTKENKNE